MVRFFNNCSITASTVNEKYIKRDYGTNYSFSQNLIMKGHCFSSQNRLHAFDQHTYKKEKEKASDSDL